MQLQSLQSLYEHELLDLRDAEDRIMEILPRMADAASDDELRDQLSRHAEQARTHRDRIDTLLKKHEVAPDDTKCAGMRGILHEAERLMDGDGIDRSVLNAALVAIAQRAEHYEMAAYGALRTYAGLLGDTEGEEILQKTLEEEGKADDRLTRIAERSINREARA